MSAFTAAVRLERAYLALTDPAGEWDALVRWPWHDALAYCIRELAERKSMTPGVLTTRRPFDNAALLEALGVPPGRTSAMVKCPSHEDRSPSLSVRVTQTGRLLMHCFGGCGWPEILAAVAA